MNNNEDNFITCYLLGDEGIVSIVAYDNEDGSIVMKGRYPLYIYQENKNWFRTKEKAAEEFNRRLNLKIKKLQNKLTNLKKLVKEEVPCFCGSGLEKLDCFGIDFSKMK